MGEDIETYNDKEVAKIAKNYYEAGLEQRKKKKIKKGIVEKLMTKRFFSKPKSKIQSRDILRELKKSQGYKLVREVEKPEITEDKRSLYFKDEFTKEMKRGVKWLN